MKDYAVLEWRDGLPYSPNFKDIYFSVSPEHTQHGLAESRHVFLQHNQLAARWQALPTQHPSHFTIVETGFGSGLNFLAALQCWCATAPAHATLHYVSLEVAPFTLNDLQRAHSHFPELAALSLALCAQYKVLQPGINHLSLPQHRVELTLLIGEVGRFFPWLTFPVDAWFLDGFAPAKNPEMWQQVLFDTMARTARNQTSFATFTCAGIVRRGLQQAGFRVHKVAGYGAKREMLCGVWPQPVPAQAQQPLPHVAVIGAGIAGCSTAYALAQLGCQVSVYERQPQIARGASGNPRGMLYPRLNAEKPLNDQLALRAYSHSLRHYGQLLPSPQHFAACGVLQLGGSPREYKRVHKVHTRYGDTGLMQLCTPAQATAIAGVPIAHDSLWFADGGWVHPQAACHALLQQHNITLHAQHTVSALHQSAQGWQLVLVEQPYSPTVDAVVICTAADARTLLPESGMQLNPVRGQMGMVSTQPGWQALQTILCGDGYVTPAMDGLHALGATFAPGDTDCAIRAADNAANLQMLTSLSAQFSKANQATTPFARASLRCGSPDYLPYVGPVFDMATLSALPPPASYQDLPDARGLYVHVAHGSKGLLTAPYCAQLLARRLLTAYGHALPTLSENSFWHGLHPQRHLFRQRGWHALWQPFNAETLT